MSHQPLQRGPITKAVLAAARSTDFPAEVALIPKDGGWRDGAPAGDRSLFTPYTVVVPQTASFTTGALDYGQDDWHLPYAFNYYAIQNTQIEDFADLVRVAVAGIVGSVVPILSGPDYKIIKVAAKGESTGFRFLGIIPLASPKYSEAKQSLYESVGEPLEGRAIALVNQTEDRSFMYFILFSIPKITLTADIIEYLDEPPK